MIEKSLTEEYTFKQYTSTSRRMRGKKYCLLVAKECIQDDDGSYLRGTEKVVGMVEMGMSLCPVSLDHQIDSCSDGDDGNDNVILANNNNHDIGLRPQPTVGVLCVDHIHQKKGIGQALVERCEQVAAEVWSEKFIHVDVEPNNQNALTFFGACGYHGLVDESGGMRKRNATVLRRRAAESRPHYLLSKRLTRNRKEEIIGPDERIDLL